MPNEKRAGLQQEVIQALIESKAVDFEAVGAVLSKYGARAALEGSGLAIKINWRVMDACIPVDFEEIGRVGLEQPQG